MGWCDGLDSKWNAAPFDRILIAQAVAEGLGVVTSDRLMSTPSSCLSSTGRRQGRRPRIEALTPEAA